MALVLIGLQAAGIPGVLMALVAKPTPSSLIAYYGGAWFDRRERVPGWRPCARAWRPSRWG